MALIISEKLFVCMHKLPKLHRNYSSGASIWVSVHPSEENILLLDNIDPSNNTPGQKKIVPENSEILIFAIYLVRKGIFFLKGQYQPGLGF